MSCHDAHYLSKETRKNAHDAVIVGATRNSTTGKHDVHADALGEGRDTRTQAAANVNTGRNGRQVEHT